MDVENIDFDGDIEVDSVEITFNKAANFLQQLVDKLDPATLLAFYGLYKQSTVGPCNTSKPGIFSIQGRAKWNAWNDLNGMPQKEAMKLYVEKLREIEPEWDKEDENNSSRKSKNTSWVSVSTPFFSDINDDLMSAEKTFHDHVRDGNLEAVQTILSDHECKETIIRAYDDNGLGAIHWAADRDHAHILELLLKHGADVNLIDKESGQTALHYAVSCSHYECVKILINYGADRTIRDHDMTTCLDIATESNDPNILQLLSN